MIKNLSWKVGHSKLLMSKPREKVDAQVPGAVQLDWANAKNYPPYYYGNNYNQYKWMEDEYWTYSSKIDIGKISDDDSVYFISEGIDYKFEIHLDNECIHKQEGMFTPVKLDITSKIKKKSFIEVIIYPIPKREGAPESRIEADQSCKPALSYGWDWHPRLVPSGIWDKTYIEIKHKHHLKDVSVDYVISDDLSNVIIEFRGYSNIKDGKCSIELVDPIANVVFEKTVMVNNGKIKYSYTLDNPILWWPNGHGDQSIYTYNLVLEDNEIIIDYTSGSVGFRKTRLVMHDGAWDGELPFPKTRNNPPITMEINNRNVFCKGSNWVNPEIFPGIINRDTYQPLIQLAKNANMNMYRIWGGGIVNKDCFYEICDELGIMIWQEFPLACNNYVGSQDYLQILDQESKSIIKKLNPHPCVVMYCGGNELFNSWSGMDDQSLALRLLNKNTYELAKHIPFIMTSPLMGMAHGCYLFKYHDGRSVHEVMVDADNTAYTEFGVPSPSDYDYLLTFMSEEEANDPKPFEVWEDHHAYGAWGTGGSDTWLCKETIEYYYKANDVKELIKAGQLLQSEGYKCIYEEARRQKPRCSMALNWCYNEPWPSAANNSIINWPAIPKPAYYAIAKSCRPVLASARLKKYEFYPNEMFEAELWMLNDSYNRVKSDEIKVYLKIAGKTYLILRWKFPYLWENENMQGPTARFLLPDVNVDKIELILEVNKAPEYNSNYILCYRKSNDNKDSNEVKQLNV